MRILATATLRRSVATLIFTVFYSLNCYAYEKTLSTERFMGVLALCAAGADIELKGDLVGSISSLYEGERTKGLATLKVETKFLNSLPNASRDDAYKLYVGCIKEIITDPLEALFEMQRGIIRDFDQNTPLSTIYAAFGLPKKIMKAEDPSDKTRLEYYDGAGFELIVVTIQKENTGRFAISAVSAPNLQVKSFDDAFNVTKLADMMDCEAPTSADARHVFFATRCDYGRPGMYLTYTWGFKFPYGDGECAIDPMDWEEKVLLQDAGCNEAALSVKPNFVYVSEDPKDDLGFRIQYVNYWWEEKTF